MLIAIEGIDQSGKATQAKILFNKLQDSNPITNIFSYSFPVYTTRIGMEIRAYLEGVQNYSNEVFQLLCIANRYEQIHSLVSAKGHKEIHLILDRYKASGRVYGMAAGLDPVWIDECQENLPDPDLTIFIKIDPEAARKRKTVDRDRYESNSIIMKISNREYKRICARSLDWVAVDGEMDKDSISDKIWRIVNEKLGIE